MATCAGVRLPTPRPFYGRAGPLRPCGRAVSLAEAAVRGRRFLGAMAMPAAARTFTLLIFYFAPAIVCAEEGPLTAVGVASVDIPPTHAVRMNGYGGAR